MENYELIENYFEGKLSEEEKASVDSLLLSNSDFKDEFELYKNIVFGIKEAGKEHLKNKLKEADMELDEGTPLTQVTKEKTNFKFIAIAASVLIIIGATSFYFFFKSPDLPELASKYYEPEIGLPVELAVSNSKWDAVMNDLKSGNIKESKEKLDKLKSSGTNDTLSYFEGVLDYELKNYGEAIKNFSSVNESAYYFQKAQYRLVLSYLMSKNKKSALEAIDKATANKYFAKLSELKAELSK